MVIFPLLWLFIGTLYIVVYANAVRITRPDNCDGTYEANCDKDREYSNITAILEELGKDETLKDMNTYWKDYKGDDESFWSHEWNKHGTCISTLDTECYEDYKPQAEVGDFFDKTVALFKEVNTYKVHLLHVSNLTLSEALNEQTCLT